MQTDKNGLHEKSTGINYSRHRAFFAPAALFIILLIVYWPGFSGQWFFDDIPNIHDNRKIHLRSLVPTDIIETVQSNNSRVNLNHRPLAYLSLAFNYYIGGTDPLGYHIFNFTVHFSGAVLLFALIFTLILNSPVFPTDFKKNAYPVALLSALLWAVHPIQVMAVTYIVQRMAVMAGFFTILSLYFFVKGRFSGHFRKIGMLYFSLSFIAGLCALASKQNAAMLPFSMLLLDLLLIKGYSPENASRAFKLLLIPVFLAAVLAFIYSVSPASILAGYDVRPFTPWQRLLTEPRIIFFYLSLIAYPLSSRLTLLHDIPLSTALFSPVTTFLSILALLLLVLFACRRVKKSPLLSFAILFFLLNHLIEGTILPLELIFEHRNYLPSIFLFASISAGFFTVHHYFKKRPAIQVLAATTAVVVLISIGHTTYMQNLLFQSRTVFWVENVNKYPDLHRPRHNLAKAYLSLDLVDPAIEQMYLALNKKNTARKDQKLSTYYNLGMCQLFKQQYTSTISTAQKALEVNGHPAFHNMIAEAYLYMEKPAEAEKAALSALSKEPFNPIYLTTYSWALLKRGDIEKGLSVALSVIKKSSNVSNKAYFAVGEALRVLGRLRTATFFLQRYYRSTPNDFAINAALFELQMAMGKPDRGLPYYANMVRLSTGKGLDEHLEIYDKRYNSLGRERLALLRQGICSFYQ